MFEMNSFTSADDLRNNFASLTLQTTPELTQQVMDYIRANPDPGLWTAAGPNCSTEVWKILQKFKLAKAGLLERPGARPKLLWNALVRQWNPSQIGVKPANGKDYGHPRFDMFELLWQSLPQSHEQVTHKIDYNPPPETPQNQ
jgi:hypothetical protein